MSSILTNDSASIALMTLQGVNSSIADVQKEIATGKRVSGADDNAAVWAIAKTMQADVEGYKKVSDSLALGSATLSVARQGAETITDLLTEMKGKIVSAQGENVDRAKIQTDVDALREQIGAVVDSAQFNGLNLLKNQDSASGSGEVNVLGFLQRDASGVRGVDIAVAKHDLGTAQSAISATGGTYNASAATTTLNATQTGTVSGAGITVSAGMGFNLQIFGTDGDGSSFSQANMRTSALAAQTQAEMASSEISYVARDGDTMNDVMTGLKAAYDSYAGDNGIATSTLSMTVSGNNMSIASSVTTGGDTIAVTLASLSSDAGNTIGGGLASLADIDVSTGRGATAALDQIEGLLQTSVNAAASFGSDEKRLDTQTAFNSKLTSAMQSGIGTLVDADLEEELVTET